MKLRERWWRTVVHRVYWHVGRFGGRVHGHGPLVVAMGDSLTDPFIGFTWPWQNWVRYVGRHGYKTVNLGNGSDSTAAMAERVEQFLAYGRPEIVVLFAGNVDAEYGHDPAETERSVRFILDWLRAAGVEKIVVIGPGMMNLPALPEYMPQVTDWFDAIAKIRSILRDAAAEHDAVFLDLAQFLQDRLDRGEDPDFSRVPYRQSRSWHAIPGDGHFNAYGQRLIAEAFLAATANWGGAQPSQRSRPEARPSRTQQATELV
jgi:lysophospholipase L1-like esterase